MALEENLLSTPANYATHDQLKAIRDYAAAQLYGKLQQPVGHWTQGISNMVNALYGGKGLYDAGLAEKSQDLKDASSKLPDVSGAPEATPRRSTYVEPAEPEDTSPIKPKPVRTQTVLATPQAGPGGAIPYAPEPTGEPGLPQTQFDERFPGAGGIMTPSPFMANPGASSAALRANALGDPASLAGAPNAPAAIARALARGNAPPGVGPGGPALPFDAGTSVAANTAPRAAAGAKGMPTAAPAGSPSGQVVDPSTLPQRPHVSREQLFNVMSSPRIPEETKQMYLQMYIQQFQPVEADTVGGKVVVGPGGTQRFVPSIGANPLEVGTPGGGSYKGTEPSMLVPDPDKPGSFKRVIIPTERPGAGTAAPSGNAPTAPPAIPSLKDLKNKKSEAPAPEGDTTQPVKLAYAGDELPPGMLGVKPPGFPTQPAEPSAAGETHAEEKVAQNSGLIPPEVAATMDYLQSKGLAYERQKEFNKKDVDSFDKAYTDLADAGQRASQGMPMLEMAKNIVSDPKFYSGIGGSDIVLPVKRLQAQFGNDPGAATRMELFQKVVSGQIVEDMKIMLKGLGQVRVAEIDLLSKAAANLNNTRGANIAVLDLAMRAHKQIDGLSRVANAYRDGWTMDANGDWARNPNPPTKAGLDALMKSYSEAQPTLSPEERQHYESLFGKYDKTRAAQVKAELESAAKGSSTTENAGSEPKGTKPPPPPPGFK